MSVATFILVIAALAAFDEWIDRRQCFTVMYVVDGMIIESRSYRI